MLFNQNFIQTLPAQVRLSCGGIANTDVLKLERVWHDNIMEATLTNCSGHAVRVREVALAYGAFPVAASCPFYAEGYHMLSQYGGTLKQPYNIGKYGPDKEFFKFDETVFNKDLFTVHNLLLLSPTQRARVLMAFSSCNKFLGEFRFRDSYIEIIMDTEDMLLESGESWALEEFAFSTVRRGKDCLPGWPIESQSIIHRLNIRKRRLAGARTIVYAGLRRTLCMGRQKR